MSAILCEFFYLREMVAMSHWPISFEDYISLVLECLCGEGERRVHWDDIGAKYRDTL